MNRSDFAAAYREGPYTSIGSYPKYWLKTGTVISCHDCLRARLRSVMVDYRGGKEPIVEVLVNWESATLCCDYCELPIESAYGGEPRLAYSELTYIEPERYWGRSKRVGYARTATEVVRRRVSPNGASYWVADLDEVRGAWEPQYRAPSVLRVAWQAVDGGEDSGERR